MREGDIFHHSQKRISTGGKDKFRLIHEGEGGERQRETSTSFSNMRRRGRTPIPSFSRGRGNSVGGGKGGGLLSNSEKGRGGDNTEKRHVYSRSKSLTSNKKEKGIEPPHDGAKGPHCRKRKEEFRSRYAEDKKKNLRSAWIERGRTNNNEEKERDARI